MFVVVLTMSHFLFLWNSFVNWLRIALLSLTLFSFPSFFSRSVAVADVPAFSPFTAPKLEKTPLHGLLKSIPSRKTAFTVTQEWAGTPPSTSCTWNVKGKDLEMVPVDFPLERTHREISCSDASEVAKRISEALRLLSIDAKYDDEKAKAKCKTMECVKFRIRLFAGGDNGEPVVVECQRRSGSTSCFMRNCRAVLDAAEGIAEGTSKTFHTKTFAPPPSGNLGSMKCLQKVATSISNSDEDARVAFQSAAELCKSEKRDSVLLGLQSLCCLTDPLKSSPATAIQVSKWIFLGDGSQYSIRDDILSAIEFVNEEKDEEIDESYETQKHFALIAVANALVMCTKDSSFSESFADHSLWFENNLIPVLLKAIGRAPICASNACAAARGIYSLLSSSKDACRNFKESDGMATIQMAHAFGLEKHDLLASETGRCLAL